MAQLNPGVAVWLSLAILVATAMSQSILLPSIPTSQKDSPLANLWEQGLRNQADSGVQLIRSEKPAPKTYVAPNFIEVINWVPQDSAHPLYANKYADFLEEILMDYMSEEEVKPDDRRINEPNGLQVPNLNGKTLTFTRDASSVAVWLLLAILVTTAMSQSIILPSIPASQKDSPLICLWEKGLENQGEIGGQFTKRSEPAISVNGVPVSKSKVNEDGTTSYILSKSLFDHRSKIHDVWKVYIKTVPVYDPFGNLMGGPQEPPSSPEPAP